MVLRKRTYGAMSDRELAMGRKVAGRSARRTPRSTYGAMSDRELAMYRRGRSTRTTARSAGRAAINGARALLSKRK